MRGTNMTNYADWNDTHLDVLPAEFAEDFDFDFREDDGWSERDDFDGEGYFGGEDAYLDTYWESVFEVDYEPPF